MADTAASKHGGSFATTLATTLATMLATNFAPTHASKLQREKAPMSAASLTDAFSLPAQMPERIRRLPRSDDGWPLPFYTAWHDGKPALGHVDETKRLEAIQRKRCWICGEHLGAYLCFTLPAPNAVVGASYYPPSHLTCAGYAVVAGGPWAVQEKPQAVPTGEHAAVLDLGSGSGVTVLWSTKSYVMEKAGNAYLCALGPPHALAWFKDGRAATFAEADASVSDICRLLAVEAEKRGAAAMRDLTATIEALLPMMPGSPQDAEP